MYLQLLVVVEGTRKEAALALPNFAPEASPTSNPLSPEKRCISNWQAPMFADSKSVVNLKHRFGPKAFGESSCAKLETEIRAKGLRRAKTC